MKKSLVLILIFSALTTHAVEYTILFNSSTGDSSSATSTYEDIILSATDNCAVKINYADKVYRAKEDFGIKLGNSSTAGRLSIGLNTTYNIQSMTIYAAAYGGNNKDSINAVRICGDTIRWQSGQATQISAYTLRAPGATDSITLAAIKNKNNRFYVQKIVFTAEDPLPDLAKITIPSAINFGTATVIDNEPTTDATNINVSARCAQDSLVLKLKIGSTFSLTPTQLPQSGGNVNVAYTITSFSGGDRTINDSLIVIAKGTNSTTTRKAIPVSVYAMSKKSTDLPVDSSCMHIGHMPADYYRLAQGLSDSLLKAALTDIILCGPRYKYGGGRRHTWNGFFFTDRDTVTQQVLDMYSNNKRYFNTEDTCRSVAQLDIEHMVPNAWWGHFDNAAFRDLYHLVPADYSANRSKSDNAPSIPTDTTFNNGSFVTGRSNAYVVDRVFCPADEYKGDFARAYFYIVTCYDTMQWITTGDAGKSMNNLSYLKFRPWLQDVLLSWHRLDPVSDKELARAIEVNKIQGNRNPFIDYPELVEYIWGNRRGQAVNFYTLTQSYGDPYNDTPSSLPIETDDMDHQIVKILVDDKVYILKDGEYFTILGQ